MFWVKGKRAWSLWQWKEKEVLLELIQRRGPFKPYECAGKKTCLGHERNHRIWNLARPPILFISIFSSILLSSTLRFLILIYFHFSSFFFPLFLSHHFPSSLSKSWLHIFLMFSTIKREQTIKFFGIVNIASNVMWSLIIFMARCILPFYYPLEPPPC